jgi:hypothetical protein
MDFRFSQEAVETRARRGWKIIPSGTWAAKEALLGSLALPVIKVAELPPP